MEYVIVMQYRKKDEKQGMKNIFVSARGGNRRRFSDLTI
jgi:hypothetical protein